MEENDELFIELRVGGDTIKISLDKDTARQSEDWLKGIVSIKAGVFSGLYKTDLMLREFINFKNGLQELYANLKGEAKFENLEGQIKIEVKGDGLGHMIATCKASDDSNYEYWNVLNFVLNFDQTYIPGLIKQLDKIIAIFA